MAVVRHLELESHRILVIVLVYTSSYKISPKSDHILVKYGNMIILEWRSSAILDFESLKFFIFDSHYFRILHFLQYFSKIGESAEL